jgi:hypothetical protein
VYRESRYRSIAAGGDRDRLMGWRLEVELMLHIKGDEGLETFHCSNVQLLPQKVMVIHDYYHQNGTIAVL